MKRAIWLMTVLLAGGLAVGCEDKSEPAAPSGSATPKSDSSMPSGSDVAKQADDMTKKMSDTASGATAAAEAKAKELLDQATTYIKENKFELAEKTIDQAEAMKANLPESVVGQIENARKALAAAKAAAGSGAPAMPK